jgi:dipeptidyl aminopeptidase/acylaminoacyl peptidase
MLKPFQFSLISMAVFMMAACQSSSQIAKTPTLPLSHAAEEALISNHLQQETTLEQHSIESQANTITLEKIMSDPDWIGRFANNVGWSVLGDHIVFERKRVDSNVQDVFFISPENIVINGELAPLKDIHLLQADERVVSQDQRFIAWIYADIGFIYDAKSRAAHSFSHGEEAVSQLQFMLDGRLSFKQGSHIYAIDPESFKRQSLFHWTFSEEPVAVEAAPDYIAQEQIKLIQYIQVKRQQRQERADYQKQLSQANSQLTQTPFYFDKDHRLSAVSVAPNGKWAIIATRQQSQWRQESDIMPHYIQEDGRIASMPVRSRVADAKPQNDELYLLDLTNNSIHPLSKSVLPGYNDDVLETVKRENAQAQGETYQTNRLPRDITLMSSWYWSEPPIYWHSTDNQVGIMLEAWDNKDRWIATVDFDKKSLVTQHRLSDEAWVNYAFNRFGWLKNEASLYFLSEHSGYSQLYVKPVAGDLRALTQGEFVVDSITQSPDGQYIYYKANKKHPGVYEIYRVDTQNAVTEALTDLNGMTDYVLSPDGTQLVLTYSTMNRPPELLLASTGDEHVPLALSRFVSDEYLAMGFNAPSIIEVPSSHVDRPIYSRLYLPTQSELSASRRAVIFNHGAGYLQNSHMGWSGYFREYMFHNMLAQQGYVVLDMDYRASKGYGRDWRTAIYRQMGTPEVQDLRDGVDWLVANANVDRQRIGTYGGSYGGFMTFMAMFTAPDLFQAGAALRPVSDWAHYNTPYTANILNTPDIDPIAYERSSPIYFAEGLEKPLLMNAPMVDDNVFFVDVARLVQRLIELEKIHFETAIYPVEPHGFVQPSSWLDEYRRIFMLFEENL